MKKVLVTGASGQLGQCIRKKAAHFPDLEFVFADSELLDLTLFGVVNTYFRKYKFDYCINCAAYTNVEKAETEREMAFYVNAEAVKNLALACEQNRVTLIHFSTDYVFDGTKNAPYTEEDETNPINVYGSSKLEGERHIQRILKEYFIFRTSWLYSDQGHNFFRTILEKAQKGAVLKITTSQTGTPTNAYDLAEFILHLISQGSTAYGVYHYSNLGEATWYEFAETILKLASKLDEVELVKDDSYETLAARPGYSVLCKDKALKNFSQEIYPWRESLAQLF